MSASLVSNWIVGFVTQAEPLPTGAIRLTLNNGQTGIVENPQSVSPYLLEVSEHNGVSRQTVHRKDEQGIWHEVPGGEGVSGIAFKKNEQGVITEITMAEIGCLIRVGWNEASSSFNLFWKWYHDNEARRALQHQEAYLTLRTELMASWYELHPTLPGFTHYSRIAEDAARNEKRVDYVFGNDPRLPGEIVHIQYSSLASDAPSGNTLLSGKDQNKTDAPSASDWIIGFVTEVKPLPTGAIRLTLDTRQIGIVENPQEVLSYLLKPGKQIGRSYGDLAHQNRGVAFQKNKQGRITEIRSARLRSRIYPHWEEVSSSAVLSRMRQFGGEAGEPLLQQENYLAIGAFPTPTNYELLPRQPNFANYSRIAEDAAKNKKFVDMVFGEDPFEIIHIRYTPPALETLSSKVSFPAQDQGKTDVSPASDWSVGFVTKAESLPTGAVQLTLDNGQVAIVENPQDLELSYLLKPGKQDGHYNNGVALKKNEQNIVSEIRSAYVRTHIKADWKEAPSSSVLAFYRRYGSEAEKQRLHQENYLGIGAAAYSPHELHPTLPGFANYSGIAEDASKNKKFVDVVLGENLSEVIHLQYTQSVFENPSGRHLSDDVAKTEAIRQKLVEILKQQQPSEKYASLVVEMEKASVYTTDGNAIISSGWNEWKLTRRGDLVLLEPWKARGTQQVLSFEAPLEWQDGEWRVPFIRDLKIQGAGYGK